MAQCDIYLAAVKSGAHKYNTMKPCHRGHLADRYTSTRICIVCSYEDTARIRKENPKLRAKYAKNHRDRHRNDLSSWSKNISTSIKCRCLKQNIPCNISSSDIFDAIPKDKPCPVLGLNLVFGQKINKHTASVDRLIPSLGYIKGNICVISYRANTLKRDVTDPDELRRVASYIERSIYA